MSKSILKTATLTELSAGRVRAVLGLALVTVLISAGLFPKARADADDNLPGAAGDLDPSFGVGGKVVTDFPHPAGANAMTIQADGKLIVAGVVQLPAGFDFGLARYNPDGSLDTGFSTGGAVTTDFSGGDDRAFAIGLQPDGKIVVAGTATTPTGAFDFGLARYNSNGTLDMSFGSGGKVTTDFNGREDRILAILILPEGEILAAGFATDAAGVSVGAVAGYRPDGSLDGKFAEDAGGIKVWSALALQPDGKLVLAGSVLESQGPRDDFLLDRITADIEPDGGFGNHGHVVTNFGGNDDPFALALQPDDKIVAAGVSGQAGISEFALARYNTDGSLDASFGSNGKVRTSSLGSVGKPAIARAVLIQPDGKIVVVGFSTTGASGSDFTLVRLNADGSSNSTFGSGGTVKTDFFGGDDQARAALIQPDGKIVVAGFASQIPGGPTQVALARYLSGVAPDFSINFDQPTVTAERGTKTQVLVRINRVETQVPDLQGKLRHLTCASVPLLPSPQTTGTAVVKQSSARSAPPQ